MKLAVAALGFLLACGDHKAKPDGPVPDAMTDASGCGDCDAPLDANPLDTLFGTGLCVDRACTQITPGIMIYTPRFPLWADTASKARWAYVPPGMQIDTSDPDHWVFPQGTKLWKEFTRDNVRVETRFIWKKGPGNTAQDWYYMPYQWNATNDDTAAVPFGVPNANGTAHDIPSQAQCRGCHENLQPSRVLGFQAIQLDYDNTTPGESDLDDLIGASMLTSAPPGASSPHYPLPSDTNNQYATDALGYLHANCGHCHNPTSNVYMFNNVAMVLRLDTTTLSTVGATPAYTTAVNQNATINIGTGHTKIIAVDDPTMSVMIDRYDATNPQIHMPALGSKMTDPTGDTLLHNWITHL